jgi:hypothetical protein
MAGFVPNAWAARLLEATAGRTAITAGNVYLGLAYGFTAGVEDPLTATLATVREVAVAGYARVQIPTFSNAATTVPPVRLVAPTAFSFPAFTADMTEEANYAFIADVASGTAGNLRFVFTLQIPVLGRAGEPLNVPASTLIIE